MAVAPLEMIKCCVISFCQVERYFCKKIKNKLPRMFLKVQSEDDSLKWRSILIVVSFKNFLDKQAESSFVSPDPVTYFLGCSAPLWCTASRLCDRYSVRCASCSLSANIVPFLCAHLFISCSNGSPCCSYPHILRTYVVSQRLLQFDLFPPRITNSPVLTCRWDSWKSACMYVCRWRRAS